MQHWQSKPRDYSFPVEEVDEELGSLSADQEANQRIVEVGVTSHGELKALGIYAPQDGNANAFTFNIYQSREAAELAAMEDDSHWWKAQALFPSPQAFDGQALRLEGLKLPYTNMDGGQSNRKRVLYLVSNDAPSETSFHFTVTVQQPRPV